MRHRDAASAACGDAGDHEPTRVEDRVTCALRVERERVGLPGKELRESLRRHRVKRGAGLLRRALVREEIDGGAYRVFGFSLNPCRTFLLCVGALPETVTERLRLHALGNQRGK
jgi:hypothetical protein